MSSFSHFVCPFYPLCLFCPLRPFCPLCPFKRVLSQNVVRNLAKSKNGHGQNGQCHPLNYNFLKTFLVWFAVRDIVRFVAFTRMRLRKGSKIVSNKDVFNDIAPRLVSFFHEKGFQTSTKQSVVR